MFQAFLGYVKVLEGVPGFLEGVAGRCSGFFTLSGCSGVFRGFQCSVFRCSGVPVFRCSGVSVFRCSGVPVFLELLHAKIILGAWRLSDQLSISCINNA